MRMIKYEDYVLKHVENKGMYSRVHWYEWKSSFMKPNLFHYRYTFILFTRYMHNDISIKWDMER